MANYEHIAHLMKGVAAWNDWREENPDTRPDLRNASLNGLNLRDANLRDVDLMEANLMGADLSEASLSGTDLYCANLSKAALVGTDLSHANLFEADLSGANLSGANLMAASLMRAKLGEANLSGADLQSASLLNADLTSADLTGCRIYGVSAWGLKLENAKQQNLVITPEDEPAITIDNIEVAQFIYLLLHNEKIRDVIDTVTARAVLILGRSSRLSVRKSSTHCVTSCAGVTMCQSCSTSLFRQGGTLPRPSHCWLAWPVSSLPT
jgi:hypothetical protein